MRGFPRVCHLTRSSRVLPLLVCAFGWVGKGMMCVRAAPQTKFFEIFFKNPLTNSRNYAIIGIESEGNGMGFGCFILGVLVTVFVYEAKRIL